MVDKFHDAGLEVLLDVVYNHTAESNHLGPTISFRGIDNASYYRLQAEQPRYYVNDTGCGNTLDVSHPRVMQMVMDSLRYWSGEMGVDGFRFDLAPVLAREAQGFNPRASFLQALAQDPQLSRLKLIAEPWDIGPGGYRLGAFPAGWSEWNDDYRDTVRRFWRAEPGHLPTFARRLHGSSDIFERSGRRPRASLNFVSSHDGFTLRDLVSYQQRHNLDNGEDGNDGHRENLSQNFGVEGATEDHRVNAARRRQQRNLLATLLLSQGVPMLLAGDEMHRSQGGNNNAYCQDNETNWLDWETSVEKVEMRAFVTRLTDLRRRYRVLGHRHYIHPPFEAGAANIQWLNSDGREMREEHWQEHHSFLLGYLLTGPGESTSLLVIFNNCHTDQQFRLPRQPERGNWVALLDTADEQGRGSMSPARAQDIIDVAEHSVLVLSDDAEPGEI